MRKGCRNDYIEAFGAVYSAKNKNKNKKQKNKRQNKKKNGCKKICTGLQQLPSEDEG